MPQFLLVETTMMVNVPSTCREPVSLLPAKSNSCSWINLVKFVATTQYVFFFVLNKYKTHLSQTYVLRIEDTCLK